MTVKLLTEQHLEFLSLKGGCTGSSESTLVKMPHLLESHVEAQLYSIPNTKNQFMCLSHMQVVDRYIRLMLQNVVLVSVQLGLIALSCCAQIYPSFKHTVNPIQVAFDEAI